MMTNRISTSLAVAALAASLFAPTAAQAGDRQVIRTGGCSAAADWKVKVSPENGRLEVEYEIDANRRAQRWQVRLFHGPRRMHEVVRTTRGRSGSFSVRDLARNTAGADRFRIRAVRVGGDQRCVGRVRF